MKEIHRFGEFLNHLVVHYAKGEWMKIHLMCGGEHIHSLQNMELGSEVARLHKG